MGNTTCKVVPLENHFEKLPNELIWLIYEHIPHKQNFSSSCKRFREITMNVEHDVQRIYIRDAIKQIQDTLKKQLCLNLVCDNHRVYFHGFGNHLVLCIYGEQKLHSCSFFNLGKDPGILKYILTQNPFIIDHLKNDVCAWTPLEKKILALNKHGHLL
jgi:hypothetical protein